MIGTFAILSYSAIAAIIGIAMDYRIQRGRAGWERELGAGAQVAICALWLPVAIAGGVFVVLDLIHSRLRR